MRSTKSADGFASSLNSNLLPARLRPEARNPHARRKSQQAGYVLLVLMMFSALMLISLSAILPRVYLEGKREREEELIFRGREYVRAIGLFHRQFARFPTKVDELIRTDRKRFLRQAYPDPMTPDGKWRYIYVDASGQIIKPESETESGSGRRSSGFSSPLGSRSQSPASSGGSGFSLSSKSPSGTFSSSAASSSVTSGQGRNRSGVQGRFIIGVVSRSRKSSLKVWNDKRRYDEWEFIHQAGSAAGKGTSTTSSPSSSSKNPQKFPQRRQGTR